MIKTNTLQVKFGSDVLPPILNALETKNGDQKLVLEVAVSFSTMQELLDKG